jgi:AraC-like DNA-binding protein
MTIVREEYAEHPPSPALADYVACYWTSVSSGEGPHVPRAHRVLPDGCLDIIVNLGEPWVAVGPSAMPVTDRVYVVGAMTRSLVLARQGPAHFVAVRFRPGRAAALLRVAARELTDRHTPLGDIWPDASTLADRVAGEGSLAGQINALDRVLAARAGRVLARPAALDLAVRYILSSHGQASIESICELVGRSRQHLARLFADHVGLSPKMLARVIRAQKAVAQIRGGRSAAASALALDLGYYDQSHLVSELKELTGLTPGAWSEER